ncbi:MAG: 2-oxoacid:acceptor oxidoreductase subunit alpha [Candidatus Pacebacteria bacterium]|nr:2-oxoacid:acceptor oxidoreductase subunit alpha [Candidatus Paceibacterota bacterium]MDD4333743.1 2-oxoacid:acceptor oxidoreductase subunit alpha [Candidatus Paceibacterota bacterium]
MKDFTILVGGQAGQGSRKAGLVIAKILNNLGYRIFIYDDYQSLIKGGHSFSKVRASFKKVLSQEEEVNFLLALDEETLKRHLKEIKDDKFIIFNADKIKSEKGIGINIETIAKEEGGSPIMANTAIISAFAKMVGIDFSLLKNVFEKEFKKGLDINLKIAERVYGEVEEKIKIEKLENKPLPLITGNEALALGAVKAGLEMYYAYPMTPATSILHFLAERKLGVETIQLENEISVIIAAIGSAYAGKRSMVGTSGGGFALMTEGISLATISETPVVIVNSQRSGPATGVPTYSGQSDLNFVLNAGHGDIVKFTIAPSNADECYYWGGKILNLAFKYQTPAVLLIDKEISESTFNLEIKEDVSKEEALLSGKGEDYKRYEFSENGISPLAFPGKEAIVKATSYEHDEFGLTAEESEEEIVLMQEKRLRKFEAMQEEVDNMENAINVYGKKDSKNVLFTFGSSTGPVVEVAEKFDLKVIQLVVLEPFPELQVLEEIENAEQIICVEQNALGQLSSLLAKNGIEANELILKYSSRVFQKQEIEDLLKEII